MQANNTFYILDCFRKKLEFPQLIKEVIRLHEQAKSQYCRAVTLMIEDKNSGTQLIQTLKNQSLYVQKITPGNDKQTRLLSVSHLIENGSCQFPSDNPHWWYDFEQELLRFPAAKHDDQCDALSQVSSNNKTPTMVIGGRPF
jgi:predicted phage terminase large subunit-like protein